MDLGVIADRTFVNNASFGAYAEVVRSPAYRDDKRGTTLQVLPDLLNGHQGARLTAQAAGTRIEGPQALLISNGPYEMGDVAGLGRRARLDAGALGVVAVRVDSARQAIGLLRRGHGQGLTVLTAGQVTVDADTPQIPVGIDGETVLLPTPVRCTIQPRALRVVVPRERPGVPAPKAGPGMAAAPATRVLPRPATQRAPPRPARQGAKHASTLEGGRLSHSPTQWPAPRAGGGRLVLPPLHTRSVAVEAGVRLTVAPVEPHEFPEQLGVEFLGLRVRLVSLGDPDAIRDLIEGELAKRHGRKHPGAPGVRVHRVGYLIDGPVEYVGEDLTP